MYFQLGYFYIKWKSKFFFYSPVYLRKKNTHKKVLLFCRTVHDKWCWHESLSNFAHLLRSSDWRSAASSRWTREAVIRPAANDFPIVDVSGAHKCPGRLGRTIYRVALIGMNVSASPPLGVHMKHENPLAPCRVNNDLDADMWSSTQHSTTCTNVGRNAQSKSYDSAK